MKPQNNLPVINSHDSWSPLQETWLGDVYPASWYEHLAPEIRDVFQELTRVTQEDLSAIQRTLELLNIIVRRPSYHAIDDFLDHNGQLTKPAICPRDTQIVIGNTLYRVDLAGADPWKQTVAFYHNDNHITACMYTCMAALRTSVKRSS